MAAINTVGIVLSSRYSWTGGMNYYENLISLRKDIRWVIICDNKVVESRFRHLNVEFRFYQRKSLFQYLLIFLSGHNSALRQILTLDTYDFVLTHGDLVGKVVGPQAIYWIPDHLHLNKSYPYLKFLRRELLIRKNIQWNNIVYVSSYHDANIVESRHNFKPLVYQFKVDTKFPKITGNTENTVLIANQWWGHKNHKLLLEGTFENIKIRITGEPDEDFKKAYYSSFRNDLVLLGFLDKYELLSEMVKCTVYCNPSHNEGWNTGVEEAKMLNKVIVVSDIPVHREQLKGYPNGYFFDPTSFTSLQQSLYLAFTHSVEAYNYSSEKYAQEIFELF